MVEEEEDGIAEAAARDSYNWEDEWYPLYLTREVPRDGPLALQVFDKQLVLHFDGHGILRCYEDRCPHRWFSSLSPLILLIMIRGSL
jgi:phenylpropionate dioxygenase-like ring-hydroxylating dioxygenase large terminal subunit